MVYINFWIAAQIILEMFPISSSGHLCLLQTFFKNNYHFDVVDFFKQKKIDPQALYYLLHGITLGIILLYFGRQWFSFIMPDHALYLRPLFWVGIADCITALVYFSLQCKSIRFPLGFGFLITAVSLFWTYTCGGQLSLMQWDYSHACFLGLVQSIALLPGISRLAFTCAAGCCLGYPLLDAFCLSWLIQAPLMGAAFIKSSKDLLENRSLGQILNLKMGLVMLASSGVSIVAFWLVMHLVTTNMFYLFGWYMLIPLLIWWLMRH